ncbi:unnamed protein product [Brassicogethes aeneus]|uniref:DNA mismatch repair proteins mutS family domain-containing protein n=1 Tax=Brassicogethes aeneus TaxID=1431903 RepID=A0A9P0B508_BRAAE|nr:unnamed protein product [Brassicogethes aeneus]
MSATEETESSDAIYNVQRPNKQYVGNSTSENNFANSSVQEENASGEESNNILCIIGRNGRIGASFYNFQEKMLYFYEEIMDAGPQYLVTQALFREVTPKYVISFGTTGDEFVKTLIHIFSNEDDETTNGVKKIPQNFYLLPLKEYTYEICKIIVFNITLMSNIENSEIKRELNIQSLINVDSKLSVQSLGGLVKYLEKNWAYFDTNKDSMQFVHIQQKTMKDHVLIDLISFKALHIFQEKWHEAGFKRGTQSANREGLSIYKLFSVHCKSTMGQTFLRNILRNPIKNIDELNRRLDFIEFSLVLENREFIESLQDNIKHLCDINNILIKIQNGRANTNDWKVIYKTMYHTVFVNELCRPFLEKSKILAEFSNSVSPELMGLEQSILDALDFTNVHLGIPSIKFGLDETLDAKKLRQKDISKNINVAARIVVEELPDFITECSIVYLPEMGHHIAINEWEPDCIPEQLEEFGYQFVFKISDTIHYKNAMCKELDKYYGDINSEIIDHENRIIRRLSGFISKYQKAIRDPLRELALIDCLLAMAKMAIERNFIRPQLNTNHVNEIVEGRHPIMDMLITGFESNDFCSGGENSRVKIITGPNGSGKSIYLKQVGMILYLAHIGSYVPAKSANIGMLHSIHCRMQANESASVRLSAFMLDISQTTKALDNANCSSLVLMDEFGRGTSINEGLSILVGILKSFVEKKQNCPHVLVSTHFQQIIKHLPVSALVEHLKMEHTKANGALCFLYKTVEGVSNSFALDIAEEIIEDPDILTRARYFFNCLQNNEPIIPLTNPINSRFQHLTNIDIDIPEPDEEELDQQMQ